MIRRLLVPLDGSALAERAVPYAVRLASATHARLTLMHGQALLASGTVPAFDVEAFAQAMREGEAVGALSARGRVGIDAIAHEVYLDRIAEGICDTARDHHADLIVMSSHGYGGIGRLFYGSIADQVLRQAPVPVLLISGACRHAWAAQGPLRMLVPLDGSPFAEAVLEPVAELAAALLADVVLVTAVGPREYPPDPSHAGEAALDADLRTAHAYLESVGERLRVGGRSVDCIARLGNVTPVVCAVAAERHVDAIAMATHGRGGVIRLALGSVASEMVQHASVPLLFVRPRTGARAVAAARATGGSPLLHERAR